MKKIIFSKKCYYIGFSHAISFMSKSSLQSDKHEKKRWKKHLSVFFANRTNSPV